MPESLLFEPTRHEVLPPEMASQLDEFTGDALESLRATRHLNKEQAFSLLVGFAGLDSPQHVSDTFTLVYTDGVTGQSNYQTACVPTYAAQAPFELHLSQDEQWGAIVAKDQSTAVHPVKVHAKITAASNHHYSRVDSNLKELPTAVIASPRSSCAAGCNGCSRGAIKSFSKPNAEYVTEHVDILKQEYLERDWDLADLVSVNITTGSQPTEDREVAMMIDIMAKYRQAGFTNARFMIYNYALKSEAAMRAVRAAGADGYIGTIETMDDDLRRKHWGRVKGGQSFEDHLRRYALAQKVGFPIVETNYVVGIDPYQTMMDGIARLDSAGIAVVPNVKRSYNATQLASTHSDVWESGFGYVTDAFDACLDSYRHPTIKRYAGEASLRWLRQHNAAEKIVAHYTELPIRHT